MGCSSAEECACEMNQYTRLFAQCQRHFPCHLQTACMLQAVDMLRIHALTFPTAKKYLGRSAIREVTEKRLPLLNTYLQSLFSLPDKIRYDTIVTGFTRPTSDDLARPYLGNQAYKSRQNGAVKPDRPARPQLPNSKEKPQRPPPMSTIRCVCTCDDHVTCM